MTDLEKVRQWVCSYPKWCEGEVLYIDHIDAVPGNSGLYPAGLEELSRHTDILGTVTVKCRYRFNLYRVATKQEDDPENAQWMMDFQQWVQQQCAAGLTPTFGDVPEQEWIRAEKGKLQDASQAGTGTYAVTLTAEFTKLYK